MGRNSAGSSPYGESTFSAFGVRSVSMSRDFRVLLVCGSFQARSANRAALDVASSYIERAAHVGDEDAKGLGDIPALNMDLGDEKLDAVFGFRRQIEHSDAVLIACPEYAGAIAGGLKTALDWIVGSGELYRKPVAIISAGTGGGAYARAQLVQTLTWQGAHVLAELGIVAPKTKSNEAGQFTDPATITGIEELTRRLLDVRGMSTESRREQVRGVTASFGIEAGHYAELDV